MISSKSEKISFCKIIFGGICLCMLLGSMASNLNASAGHYIFGEYDFDSGKYSLVITEPTLGCGRKSLQNSYISEVEDLKIIKKTWKLDKHNGKTHKMCSASNRIILLKDKKPVARFGVVAGYGCDGTVVGKDGKFILCEEHMSILKKYAKKATLKDLEFNDLEKYKKYVEKIKKWEGSIMISELTDYLGFGEGHFTAYCKRPRQNKKFKKFEDDSCISLLKESLKMKCKPGDFEVNGSFDKNYPVVGRIYATKKCYDSIKSVKNDYAGISIWSEFKLRVLIAYRNDLSIPDIPSGVKVLPLGLRESN